MTYLWGRIGCEQRTIVRKVCYSPIQIGEIMKKLNLKGITSEAVAGVLILIVALVNAVLQMFGYNTLPIADADVSEIVSTVFLIGATLYNTWKNRNVSSASQTGQKVVDAIKSGELLVEEVDELLAKVHK